MTYETYSGTAVKTVMLVTLFSLKLCQSCVFPGGAWLCTAETEGEEAAWGSHSATETPANA